MRWLLAALAFSLLAQTNRVEPKRIIQGEAIHVIEAQNAKSAKMGQKTIHLFSQADGTETGLMPVPVLMAPGSYLLQVMDEQGHLLHEAQISVLNAHYKRENISIAPSISTLKPSPGEQEAVGDFKHTVSEMRFWKEPFELPVPGCVTSPFGSMRLHNGKPTGDFHAGIDQRGAAGTPIHPIAAGVVKLVQKYNLRGGTVAIDHGQGVQSIYLHMSAFAAKEGQQVVPSDVIGYIGSTGRSTGPHVHWTLYINGEPMNPAQWMTLKSCASKPVVSDHAH